MRLILVIVFASGLALKGASDMMEQGKAPEMRWIVLLALGALAAFAWTERDRLRRWFGKR